MNSSTTKLLVLQEVAGNPPVQLDPVQQFFAPHIEILTILWVAIWCGTAAFVTAKVMREYIAYRRENKNRRL